MLQTIRPCRWTPNRKGRWSCQANTELFGATGGPRVCLLGRGGCVGGRAMTGLPGAFPAWLGPAFGFMLLTLLVLPCEGGQPDRVTERDGVICLGLWPCRESNSLAHGFCVSCQARLSVLSMETWQVTGQRVQGSCPERRCWCSGNTRPGPLQTRNAESSCLGQIFTAGPLPCLS